MENNWKPEDFAAKETKEERSVSSSINGVHSENVKPRENHLLRNVCSLQHRMNNLSIEKKKTSFAQFKVKQRNLFGLVFINTGNLVHSEIVSGEFWEGIGGKISNSMSFKVGTVDCQSEGIQVLGIAEPWPIYLEGMEECYFLEPLVIQELSHESRNILPNKEQSEVDMHGGRSCANARERRISPESTVSGWRMP